MADTTKMKIVHRHKSKTTPKSDTKPVVIEIVLPPTKNMNAFLRLLRYAEHKKDDNSVYYIIFGGGTFSDTKTHPNKLVTKGDYSSTAAGAYQILKMTFDDAVKAGIVSDFTPASQDRIATWMIKHKQANKNIDDGDIEAAIDKLKKIWVSLPGGGKQSHMNMDEAKQLFKNYGGTLKGK